MKSPKYHAYQMRILKDKEFDAKLIGVDVNGFCFIQVYNTYIEEGYDKLYRDMKEFYTSQEPKNDKKLGETELEIGLLVIVQVAGDEFVRARIHDMNLTSQTCLVVLLEDQGFKFVKFENIYRIEKRFARRCPRAVMCCLAGLELHMMTDEIANAFEQTPLPYPWNVKVKWVKDSDLFSVPIVTMTIVSGQVENVSQLIMKYGWYHLKKLETQEDKSRRLKMQQVRMGILREKLYVDVAP